MKIESHLFDAWASNYESDIIKKQNQYPFAGYFQIIDEIKKRIGSNADHFLDLGVGTGFMVDQLFDSIPSGFYALDFSEQMVQYAKNRLKTNQVLQWDIAQEVLPPTIAQLKFDIILSAFTLHHFNDDKKIAILKTYLSTLRPKGQFIIADISFDDRTKWNQCKQKEGVSWDTSEEDGYFIADEFIKKLTLSGISCQYTKVSYCTGIYFIQNN